MKQPLNVYCVNALLLKKDGYADYVGAACYETKYSKENDVRQEDICDTWRYPGSEVPRFELPGEAKSLKSELLWYDPPQLEKRVHAPFEDPVSNPERWPKNTVERTGFKGFGNLKPGVNPVLYLVVLRGSNKDEEELLLEKEKSEYSLPQYYPKEPKVKKAFIKEKIDNITKEIGCGSESEKAFQNRKQLYKGYMVQDQNTDNAWIEGKIIQVHLDLSTCSALKPKDAGKHVWPALQQLLRWEEEERRNFGRSAKAFIAQAIYPRTLRHMAKTFSIKCSGRREAPYGITMRTFEVVECDCLTYIPQDGNAGELFASESAKQLRDEMGGTCSDDELLEIVDAKRLIHGGYLKDNLNTDNAWMEGFIIHLTDPNGNCFPLPPASESSRYNWLNLPMDGDGIDDYLSPLIKPLLANYK
ncbi:hypothetical protein TTRE_0000428001 [Trichuris trichiura]|uniref:Nudix hydrolase domain-containing protein n=1 Tax=Trichuris trichiura TaxID=36087 RepID=A0A077Z721_TRITR|nr:hypothetical protein TTRE_0000428001 [Trichuris trichiura]